MEGGEVLFHEILAWIGIFSPRDLSIVWAARPIVLNESRLTSPREPPQMTSFPPRLLPQPHISFFSSQDLYGQAIVSWKPLPEGKVLDQQQDAGSLTVVLKTGASNLDRALR